MSAATRPLLGVNLPWFFGAYGHDLAPNALHLSWGSRYHPLRVYQPLVEASDLGFEAVRLWLCEKGEGIRWENNLPAGPYQALLDAVAQVQECAALLGLKVYWTLLDANAPLRDGDTLTRRILEEPACAQAFAERVAAPLARAMAPELTFAVEVLNEPETLTADVAAAGAATLSWETLGAAVDTVRDALRAERPSTPVSCGVLTPYLRAFHQQARMDLVDVHAYHEEGGLPTRAQLAQYLGEPGDTPRLPVIAGECGIPEGSPEESYQALVNFLYNAESQGYDAVFLWRLEQLLIDTKAAGKAPGRRPLTGVGRNVRHVLRTLRPRS